MDIYQTVMDEVERRDGPVIEMFEVEDSRERRVVIGFKCVAAVFLSTKTYWEKGCVGLIAFRMGGTKQYFSALSALYHFYGL